MAKRRTYTLSESTASDVAALLRRGKTGRSRIGASGTVEDGSGVVGMYAKLTAEAISGSERNYTADLYRTAGGTNAVSTGVMVRNAFEVGAAGDFDALPMGSWHKVIDERIIGVDRYAIIGSGGSGGPGEASSGVWLKVTAVASTYLTTKAWDGAATSGDDILVLPIQGHAVNDLIYAVKSRNGTSVATVTHVELLALDVTTDLYKVVQVGDTTGRLVVDWIRAH